MVTDDSRDVGRALLRFAGAQIPRKPIRVSWLQPVVSTDQVVQLCSPETIYNIRHPKLVPVFLRIWPLLDGSRSVDQIVEVVDSTGDRGSALFLLKMLTNMRLIFDGSEITGTQAGDAAAEVLRRELALFAHFGCDPNDVRRRLRICNVALLGTASFSRRVEELLLSSVGRLLAVKCSPDRSMADLRSELELAKPDLVILCAGAPMSAIAAMINGFSIDANIPWLHVAMLGKTALLGPLVIPGQSACFACFEARLRANLNPSHPAVHCDASPLGEFRDGDVGTLSAFEAIVAGQAACEAMRFLGAFAPPVAVGGCHEFSAGSPETRRHTVLRVPGCAACASAE